MRGFGSVCVGVRVCVGVGVCVFRGFACMCMCVCVCVCVCVVPDPKTNHHEWFMKWCVSVCLQRVSVCACKKLTITMMKYTQAATNQNNKKQRYNET